MSLITRPDDILYYEDKDGDKCGKTARELKRIFIDTKYWDILTNKISTDFDGLIERGFEENGIKFFPDEKEENINTMRLFIF